jgi:hypothetical protein
MEALGGADLDGDKATIFFGGEKNGFKKAWKDAYGSQKEEFYSSTGKQVKTPIKKIISGFQTGADIAGNQIAKELGLKTGGTAPKGFFTAEGNKPNYAKEYNAVEISDAQTKAYTGREKRFGPRTEQNVLNADGTVIFGNVDSPGSKLTSNLARKHNKALIKNPTAEQLNNWLVENNIETLNVAGNREGKTPGINKKVKDIIREALKEKKGVREQIVEFNKPPDMRKMFAESNPETLQRIKSPTLRYSPLMRLQASKGAYEGRAMLGPAVVNRATILATYNHVRSYLEAKGLKELKIDLGNGRQGILTPKTSQYDLREFRKRARASVALASDPMDEAGLKNMDVFFERVYESLFDVKFRYPKKEGRGFWEFSNDDILASSKRRLILNIMSGINSAGFGRNLRTHRMYTYPEFKDKMVQSENLPPIGKDRRTDVTFYGKVAKLTTPLDWTDSFLHRMESSKIDNWYRELNDILKTPEYREIRDVLGRESLVVGMQRPIKLVRGNRLWDYEYRSRLIDNDADFNNFIRSNPDLFLPKIRSLYNSNPHNEMPFPTLKNKRMEYAPLFTSLNKYVKRTDLTKNLTQQDIYEMLPEMLKSRTDKASVLDNLVRQASEFISEDLGDWSSIKLINEVWRKDAISKEEFSNIARLAEEKARIKSKLDKEREAVDELERMDLTDAQKSRLLEIERTDAGQRVSAELDQRQVDTMIAMDKQGKPQAWQDLYDALLISSWQKGNPDFVKRV